MISELYDYKDYDFLIVKQGVKQPIMFVYLKNEDKKESKVDDTPQINHSSVKVLQNKVDHYQFSNRMNAFRSR